MRLDQRIRALRNDLVVDAHPRADRARAGDGGRPRRARRGLRGRRRHSGGHRSIAARAASRATESDPAARGQRDPRRRQARRPADDRDRPVETRHRRQRAPPRARVRAPPAWPWRLCRCAASPRPRHLRRAGASRSHATPTRRAASSSPRIGSSAGIWRSSRAFPHTIAERSRRPFHACMPTAAAASPGEKTRAVTP